MFETDSQQQSSQVAADTALIWQIYDGAIAASPGLAPRERFAAYHIASLAAIEPALKITWMHRSSHARTIARGLAYMDEGAIVIPRLDDGEALLIALHETGHCRRPDGRTKLQREIDAWDWALEHTLFWGDGEYRVIKTCLESYIKREKSDARGIVAAEEWLRAARTRPARAPSDAEYDRFEQTLFERRYGPRRCTARVCVTSGIASAVALVGSTFTCRQCRPLIEARMAIQQQRQSWADENTALDAQLSLLRRTRELATVKREVGERDRRNYLAALMEGDEMRTKPNQERAVAMGRDAGRNTTLLKVIDPLVELAQGSLRCHTCGRPATSVRRIDGSKSRGLCDEPTCRTAADLDHQMHVLKQQRRGRTA